ncbi:MAG: 23S rRNA (guanosine(2251)-2'-O)-methyltransferase RlmB [Deltaproteobacteria bacterium]|jgi:23S rRNA (guanosine2251-2'-O)-methyltransferase|nr:23S rRNA (guanosine(2251)-2'-O)-methyltransferase RlmB [Deltaproteobacteria bacterium]
MSELIYGIHSVIEALKAGRRAFERIYVAEGRTPKRVALIIDLAAARGITVQSGRSSVFESLSGQIHQGIAAEVSAYPLADLSAILHRSEADARPAFILVVDHVVDPQNLGSIIRTALAAGVHGIILPKVRAASPSPTVSRTSSGGMEHALIACVTNISEVLKRLKTKGLWIVGMVIGSSTDIYSVDLTADIALVVGNEENGIRPLVRKQCDFLVSIPQTDAVGSLNAAVAGAIALYEVVRQRSESP